MSDLIAIKGGSPVRETPLGYGKQYIDDADIEAVEKVLKSDFLTCGPSIGSLEHKLCEVTGAKYAVAVSNGTAALHIACMAAGVGPGDEVITTPITFAASANCALYCGAKPVFADINPETYNISPSSIRERITPATKAVVAVDFTGQAVELDEIRTICKEHNLILIEDAAHSIGTKYKGQAVGSIADMTTFSFHPVKTVTGGEGGAIITNDKDIFETCFSLRDFGFDTSNGLDMISEEHRRLYVHNRIGCNYRMTEIQSLIGSCELERMDSWNLPLRRRNGEYLINALKDHPVVKICPFDSEERKNSFWWVPFSLDMSKLTVTIKEFIAAMAAEGVPVFSALWPELYKEDTLQQKNGIGPDNYPFNTPAAKAMDYSKVDCPVAKELAESTISFFAHPNYDICHLEKYVAAFNKVADAYMK